MNEGGTARSRPFSWQDAASPTTTARCFRRPACAS